MTVVLALGIIGAVLAASALNDQGLTVLGAVIVVAFFAVSLAVEVRAKKQ